MRRVSDGLRWLVWGTRVLARGTWDLVTLFRGGQLAASMEPWMRCPLVDDVPFDKIAADGVDAVFFDLENTLVPPGGPFTPEGRAVISRAKAAGLAVGVVSNASATWVPEALAIEGIPCIAPAGKPAKGAFLEACQMVGVPPERSVFVGDQVITDVLGSQRAGMRAVLVHPKYTKEFLSARFQRVVARVVLRLTRN
ncbi:MAG: HAD-IA family hydrolase [Actinomycetota bacterium]